MEHSEGMESATVLPLVLLLGLIYGVPGQRVPIFGGYRSQSFMPVFMSNNIQRPPTFLPNTASPFARTNIQYPRPAAPTRQIIYSSPMLYFGNPQPNIVFNRPVINNGIQRQRTMPTQTFIQNAIARPRSPAVFNQNARFMQTPLIRNYPMPFRGFAVGPGFNPLKHAKKKKKQRISVLSDPLVDIRPFPTQSMAPSHHHMKKKARMKNVAKAKPFDRLLPGTSMTQNKAKPFQSFMPSVSSNQNKG